MWYNIQQYVNGTVNMEAVFHARQLLKVILRAALALYCCCYIELPHGDSVQLLAVLVRRSA